VAGLLQSKVTLAGWRNGYWDDEAAVVAQIQQAKPDVCRGDEFAEEELFLKRWKDELQVPFVMG